jgi:hypothetical protein
VPATSTLKSHFIIEIKTNSFKMRLQYIYSPCTVPSFDKLALILYSGSQLILYSGNLLNQMCRLLKIQQDLEVRFAPAVHEKKLKMRYG